MNDSKISSQKTSVYSAQNIQINRIDIMIEPKYCNYIKNDVCVHGKKRCIICQPYKYLKQIVKTRVASVVGATKSKNCMKYLGCTIEHFKFHIESLFIDGMSWENYGDWQIDHAIPLLYSDPTWGKIIKRLNWENTQPMWKDDNFKKGNRYASLNTGIKFIPPPNNISLSDLREISKLLILDTSSAERLFPKDNSSVQLFNRIDKFPSFTTQQEKYHNYGQIRRLDGSLVGSYQQTQLNNNAMRRLDGSFVGSY